MTKILVIEQEQLVRNSILEQLTAEGYETIEAQNGRVGLTLVREHQPDLIICNSILPELDGYEVLKSIRQQIDTALMPFIFLFDRADRADVRRGMEMGADDCLTNPFTQAELLAAIAARLKKQAAIIQYAERLLTRASTSNNERSLPRVEPANTSNPANTTNNEPAKYHSTNNLASEFASLKSTQFTGKFLIAAASNQEWIFYLHQGKIVYATGGSNSVRRWQRHLATFCPQIQLNQQNLPAEIFSREAWDYLLFGLWVKQQQMSREQAAKIVQEIVTEVLFDILLCQQINYQTQPENTLPFQLLLIEFEAALSQAQKLWQTWQAANLTNFLPNRAPTIKHREALQQKTAPALYQQLTTLLNGQRTLRDLSIQMKRQTTDVTLSLLPYIQAGMVELVDLPDLPKPMSAASASLTPANRTAAPTASASPAQPSVPAAAGKSLIACIDDSPMVCQTMEHILTEAGYQIITIQDPLRAISTLLTRKPEFIFLDLVMPSLNGYEICAKLRQISHFKETPIVILSGNAIDPARAQSVGVSDYIEKPVKPEMALKMIEKYLSKTAAAVS
jgi:chemotaxis family two-component system response regulator PixG